MPLLKQIPKDLESEVPRFRRQVDAYRDDLQFSINGGQVIYCVDFSELHAFIENDSSSEEAYEDAIVSSPALYELARNHLFASMAESLYLLPTHAREMWSHVRKIEQRDHLEGMRLKRLASAFLDSLSDENRRALENIAADGQLDEAETEQLLGIIRSDGATICNDITSYINQSEYSSSLEILLDLIRSKRLIYSVQELYDQFAIDPRRQSEEFVQRVFRAFPESARDKNRFAKLLDARALVTLRDVNLLLANKARVVLITRDQSIRTVISDLSNEAWFGWSGAHNYIRSLGGALLDAIVGEKQTTSEKLNYLEQVGGRLGRLEDAINATKRIYSDDQSVSDRRNHVIAKAWGEWTEYMNLGLSLAIPEFSAKLKSGTTRSKVSTDEGAEYLARNLWTFLASESYRTPARKTADAIWSELLSNLMQLVFLDVIGEGGTDALVKTFCDIEDGATKSDPSAKLISLRFVSESHKRLYGMLPKSPESNEQRFSKIRQHLQEILEQVTSGSPTAEDFLLMAFEIFLLSRWEEACSLAERALELQGDLLKEEVYFLLGAAHRHIAQSKPDHFAVAFKFLKRAIEEKEEVRSGLGWSDPRLLKEIAAVVLEYYMSSVAPSRQGRSSFISALEPSGTSCKHAIDILEKAGELSLNDPRLRVQIYNNILYSGVVGIVEMRSHTMKSFHKKIIQSFEVNDPALPRRPWFNIRHTLAYADAKIARLHNDRESLKVATSKLGAMCGEPGLLKSDRKRIEESHQVAEDWLSECDIHLS